MLSAKREVIIALRLWLPKLHREGKQLQILEHLLKRSVDWQQPQRLRSSVEVWGAIADRDYFAGEGIEGVPVRAVFVENRAGELESIFLEAPTHSLHLAVWPAVEEEGEE